MCGMETIAVSSAAAPEIPAPLLSAGRYRVGAAYDWGFFILSPLWALALGLALGRTPLALPRWVIAGHTESLLSLFSGVFTMAHLVIVFFRSHANARIF